MAGRPNSFISNISVYSEIESRTDSNKNIKAVNGSVYTTIPGRVQDTQARTLGLFQRDVDKSSPPTTILPPGNTNGHTASDLINAVEHSKPAPLINTTIPTHYSPSKQPTPKHEPLIPPIPATPVSVTRKEDSRRESKEIEPSTEVVPEQDAVDSYKSVGVIKLPPTETVQEPIITTEHPVETVVPVQDKNGHVPVGEAAILDEPTNIVTEVQPKDETLENKNAAPEPVPRRNPSVSDSDIDNLFLDLDPLYSVPVDDIASPDQPPIKAIESIQHKTNIQEQSSVASKSTSGPRKLHWNEAVAVRSNPDSAEETAQLQSLDHEYSPYKEFPNRPPMGLDSEGFDEDGDQSIADILGQGSSRRQRREQARLERELAQSEAMIFEPEEESKMGLKLCAFFLLIFLVCSIIATVVMAVLYVESADEKWEETLSDIKDRLPLLPNEGLPFNGTSYADVFKGPGRVIVIEGTNEMDWLKPSVHTVFSWHKGEHLTIYFSEEPSEHKTTLILGDTAVSKNARYSIILNPDKYYSAKISSGKKFSVISVTPVDNTDEAISWEEFTGT